MTLHLIDFVILVVLFIVIDSFLCFVLLAGSYFYLF